MEFEISKRIVLNILEHSIAKKKIQFNFIYFGKNKGTILFTKEAQY